MWHNVISGGANAAALSLGQAAVEVLRPAKAAPAKTRVQRTEPPVLTEADAQTEAARLLAAEVRRAQSGDPQAIATLIENNRAWVRGIAYTVLGDAHLSEDAAQEVCVRVCKHLRGLDTPDPAATLLPNEIGLLVDFLLAKVVGKGEMTRAQCVEYWGSPVEACDELPQ